MWSNLVPNFGEIEQSATELWQFNYENLGADAYNFSTGACMSRRFEMNAAEKRVVWKIEAKLSIFWPYPL